MVPCSCLIILPLSGGVYQDHFSPAFREIVHSGVEKRRRSQGNGGFPGLYLVFLWYRLPGGDHRHRWMSVGRRRDYVLVPMHWRNREHSG